METGIQGKTMLELQEGLRFLSHGQKHLSLSIKALQRNEQHCCKQQLPGFPSIPILDFYYRILHMESITTHKLFLNKTSSSTHAHTHTHTWECRGGNAGFVKQRWAFLVLHMHSLSIQGWGFRWVGRPSWCTPWMMHAWGGRCGAGWWWYQDR